ncbi:MAG: CRISPR-associated protein Cas4 [Dolichospermum sp.]
MLLENINSEDYVNIASLNQYSYCPHRCWLIHCAGEFTDNQYTIEGTSLHERVHTMSAESRDETYQIRAIYLKSDQYQLIGKSDLIEFENGDYYPIEYKRGRKGEWDNDELQVCAQALCLEEMTGKNINTGYIYYAQTHQRQIVEITPELRTNTIATIEAIKMLLFTGAMPKAIKTKRCDGCSLFSRCFPQAVAKVGRYPDAN